MAGGGDRRSPACAAGAVAIGSQTILGAGGFPDDLFRGVAGVGHIHREAAEHESIIEANAQNIGLAGFQSVDDGEIALFAAVVITGQLVHLAVIQIAIGIVFRMAGKGIDAGDLRRKGEVGHLLAFNDFDIGQFAQDQGRVARIILRGGLPRFWFFCRSRHFAPGSSFHFLHLIRIDGRRNHADDHHDSQQQG